MRPSPFVTLFAALFTPLAFLPLPSAAGEPPARPVRVQSVVLAPLQLPLVLSGTVQARVQADLAFRVGGKVIRRAADPGERVKAGQVLAELDPLDLQHSLESAEAALAAAQATASQAAGDLRRYEQLGRTSPAYLPQEYDHRLAAYQAAQANVVQAQRARDLASDQRSYNTLRADADGIITSLPIQPGKVVAAGQTVASLAHSDAIEVVADVPENRLDDLRKASAITVRFWALPDLELPASLREIGGLADPASRTFAVKLALGAMPDQRLALGMTAIVHVQREGGIAAILPSGALTDQNGQPAVWVLDPATHHASLRPVAVGFYDQDGHVSVTSGLRPGEDVITAGVFAITPDMTLSAWAGATR